MLDPKTFLLEHLPLIEQIIASIGKRNGLDSSAIEELAGEVRLHLVRNDYAVLRKYQGRSPFATYMAAVVGNLLRDRRNREWGKWHASAEAERLGPLALELERHLYRDWRSLDEAIEEMSRTHRDLDRAGLEAIALRLPQRIRRRTVELEAASQVGVRDDERSVERAETAATISREITAYVQTLPELDRLLLHLRFDSEMTVAEIAHSLQSDQQALFRRLYKHFHELRRVLERAGIAAEDVADLIGKDTAALDFLKKGALRPSQEEESEADGRKKETR